MRYLVAVLLVIAFMLAIGSSGCGFMEGCGKAVSGLGDDLSKASVAARDHMYENQQSGFAQK